MQKISFARWDRDEAKHVPVPARNVELYYDNEKDALVYIVRDVTKPPGLVSAEGNPAISLPPEKSGPFPFVIIPLKDGGTLLLNSTCPTVLPGRTPVVRKDWTKVPLRDLETLTMAQMSKLNATDQRVIRKRLEAGR